MNTSKMQPVENVLDIRKLFYLLWKGKYWIIGCAGLFALVAAIYASLVRQEWVATAIVDQPTADMLGDYYLQQQWLSSLGQQQNISVESMTPSIADEVYAEFSRQLNSYNNRRDFWLQSDYAHKFLAQGGQAAAVELDILINGIRYIPADAKSMGGNTLSLTADNAKDAYQQLDAFLAFVASRTVEQLNQALNARRTTKAAILQTKIRQQETIAKTELQHKLATFEQARQIKQQYPKLSVESDKTTAMAPTSDTFSVTDLLSLDQSVLDAQLAILKALGPNLEQRYFEDQALYSELMTLPKMTNTYKPYRYLRSPEEPIKRNKPRRLFLLILWGGIGALCGAGIALVCCRNSRGNTMLSTDK